MRKAKLIKRTEVNQQEKQKGRTGSALQQTYSTVRTWVQDHKQSKQDYARLRFAELFTPAQTKECQC